MVVYARGSADGKLWLNSAEQYGGASIAIHETAVKEFLVGNQISDLEELCGCYVIAYGVNNPSFTGKPIIWCGSNTYITVRKYQSYT